MNHQTEKYIPREVDSELYAAIKSNEFCYVYGPTRSGKTSLIAEMFHDLQKDGLVCASVHSTEIVTAGISLDQWYLWLLNDLVQQILVNRLTYAEDEIQERWDQFEGISPRQAFLELFESLIIAPLVARARQAVIFIDQLELVNHDIAEDFLVAIRSIYEERSQNQAFNRITLVLAGQTPLREYRPSTPFNIGRTFKVERLEVPMKFSDHNQELLDSELKRIGALSKSGFVGLMVSRHPVYSELLCVADSETQITGGEDELDPCGGLFLPETEELRHTLVGECAIARLKQIPDNFMNEGFDGVTELGSKYDAVWTAIGQIPLQ